MQNRLRIVKISEAPLRYQVETLVDEFFAEDIKIQIWNTEILPTDEVEAD